MRCTPLTLLTVLLLAAVAALGATSPTETDAAAGPTATNLEIEALGRGFAQTHRSEVERLDAILDFIFSTPDGLGFEYQRESSRTAVEALAEGSGNCISLVNLFVALARSSGLSAGFMEVLDFEVFYREENSVVRSTHLVGGVRIDGRLTTVDFYPGRPKTYRQTRAISDRRAAAHFHNSRAVRSMLADDHEAAEAEFLQALAIDPEHAETWNNRALLRLRMNELNEAVVFLERALELDPRLLSALENLAPVYRRQHRVAEARRMEKRALEQRTHNPFFLLQRALDEIRADDLDEAEKLLRRARRIDDSIPEVHLALGRIDLLRHRSHRAEEHFARARARSAAYSESFQGRIQLKIDRLLEG